MKVFEGINLSIGYWADGKTKTIADDLNFQLEEGKLTCLLGPNGVGKSTLLKTLMGQLPALSGKLLFNGDEISNFNPKALSKILSVVLTDKVQMGNITVAELVALGRIPHTGWLGRLSAEDQKIVDGAIRETHIAYIQDQPINEISDGQLQKAMVARALAQDGAVLMLDEPTAHLDLVNRYEIMQLLVQIAKNRKKAVLVVTHDLEIAIETADEFWLMTCGEPLYTGLPEDLMLQGKLDLLIPSEKLFFDVQKGKVLTKSTQTQIQIEGPQAIRQWVHQALIKSGKASLFENSMIKIAENPLRYAVTFSGKEYQFSSLGEMIEWKSLKTTPN